MSKKYYNSLMDRYQILASKIKGKGIIVRKKEDCLAIIWDEVASIDFSGDFIDAILEGCDTRRVDYRQALSCFVEYLYNNLDFDELQKSKK